MLAEKIIRQTRGTIVAYIVDTVYNSHTEDKIIKIAQDADVFFCECSYLEADKALAAENCHMTAKQAGMAAKLAGAKCLIPIHFSKRYSGEYGKLYEEAKSQFPNVERAKIYRETSK